MPELLLQDLRNVLAHLYTDEASARRITADAGLPVVFIDWTGSAQDFWSQIVRQAEIRGGLRRLIDIALSEYTGGDYHDELLRIRRQGSPVIPIWGGGDDDRDKSLGERMASLEAQVRLILFAIGGLYIGLIWLGYLVLTRT